MKIISISHPADEQQRLDKFLKKYLPNATLGSIYKMLRTGKIKVNQKKSLPKYRLVSGDIITLFLSDDLLVDLQKVEKNCIKKSQEKVTFLYQDEAICVVHKPAGINVHPGDHKTTEISLIDQVRDTFDGIYDTLTFRPSLVHRIDRNTSGCVLIALDKKVLEHLLHQMQDHTIRKVYHAIVLGSPEQSSGIWNAPLLRQDGTSAATKVIVHLNGQKAITRYHLLQTFVVDGETLSLLECTIETGRTHQIRVHCANAGMPILGDTSYGDARSNQYFAKKYAIHRQLLHARLVEFFHPKLKKSITITAPYDADFSSLL